MHVKLCAECALKAKKWHKACPLGTTRSDVPSGQARMRTDRSPVGDFDAEGGVSIVEIDGALKVHRWPRRPACRRQPTGDAQSVTVHQRCTRFAETHCGKDLGISDLQKSED
jgi:hypothetical protein